jgi:hypothetical protein
MAQIQPISTWYQGATHQATVFSLYGTGDNLLDSATFKYQLIELIVTPGSETTVIDENGDSSIVTTPEQQFSQTLVSAEISINGQDYADWDSSISANEWIYNWAADKLGLTIVTL